MGSTHHWPYCPSSVGEQPSVGDDVGILPLLGITDLDFSLSAMEHESHRQGGKDGRHVCQIRRISRGRLGIL